MTEVGHTNPDYYAYDKWRSGVYESAGLEDPGDYEIEAAEAFRREVAQTIEVIRFFQQEGESISDQQFEIILRVADLKTNGTLSPLTPAQLMAINSQRFDEAPPRSMMEALVDVFQGGRIGTPMVANSLMPLASGSKLKVFANQFLEPYVSLRLADLSQFDCYVKINPCRNIAGMLESSLKKGGESAFQSTIVATINVYGGLNALLDDVGAFITVSADPIENLNATELTPTFGKPRTDQSEESVRQEIVKGGYGTDKSTPVWKAKVAPLAKIRGEVDFDEDESPASIAHRLVPADGTPPVSLVFFPNGPRVVYEQNPPQMAFDSFHPSRAQQEGVYPFVFSARATVSIHFKKLNMVHDMESTHMQLGFFSGSHLTEQHIQEIAKNPIAEKMWLEMKKDPRPKLREPAASLGVVSRTKSTVIPLPSEGRHGKKIPEAAKTKPLPFMLRYAGEDTKNGSSLTVLGWSGDYMEAFCPGPFMPSCEERWERALIKEKPLDAVGSPFFSSLPDTQAIKTAFATYDADKYETYPKEEFATKEVAEKVNQMDEMIHKYGLFCVKVTNPTVTFKMTSLQLLSIINGVAHRLLPPALQEAYGCYESALDRPPLNRADY